MQDELPNGENDPVAQEIQGSSPAAVDPLFPAGHIFLQSSNLALLNVCVEEPTGHLVHDVAPVELEYSP